MTEGQFRIADEAAHASKGSHWPIVLALTMTLSLVGLVTHLAVTIVGAALALGAMAAWAIERFQEPVEADGISFESIGLPVLRPGEASVEIPLEISKRAGWWGLVWFITTEALFFGNLIAAYLYLRVSSVAWLPPGVGHRELLFPSMNTVILLLSGVPAYFGLQAIKRGNRKGLQLGFLLAALLGAIFLAGQGFEYTSMGAASAGGVYFAAFFVLTGFHGLHVIAGIGLLLFVTVLSLRGRFSANNNFAVEVASTYWHFVDAVWIFLFTLLYLFS